MNDKSWVSTALQDDCLPLLTGWLYCRKGRIERARERQRRRQMSGAVRAKYRLICLAVSLPAGAPLSLFLWHTRQADQSCAFALFIAPLDDCHTAARPFVVYVKKLDDDQFCDRQRAGKMEDKRGVMWENESIMSQMSMQIGLRVALSLKVKGSWRSTKNAQI